MKTYSISFKYSNNGGKTWISTIKTVKAESDTGAISQVKSCGDKVKDIVIKSVR